MYVNADFSRGERLNMDVCFGKDVVHLVLNNDKDMVNLILSTKYFLQLQEFLGRKTDKEVRKRIEIMIESDDKDVPSLPGSVEEKAFGVRMEDWVLDL